ncbi:MAG: T9SS type A sorting domain-containing protein [Fimbriimonadaceae bacterium]|nr:T9SS type A sorting domain-containing protein [Chitinophagales bacterium]
MKKIYLHTLFIFLSQFINSQVVLEFPGIPSGSYYTTTYSFDTIEMEIEEGESIIWGFSTLSLIDSILDTTYILEITPYDEYFGLATYKSKTNDNYRFFLWNDTTYTSLGFVDNSGDIYDMSNPNEYFPLPFSYGESNIDDYDGGGTILTSERTYIGYGNLITQFTEYEDVIFLNHKFYYEEELQFEFYSFISSITFHTLSMLFKLEDGRYTGTVIKDEQSFTSLQEILFNEFKINISPNPVNENLNIQFTLSNTSKITVGLFSLNGIMNKIICNDEYNTGNQVLYFDIKDMPKGVYLVRIQINDKIIVRKIMIP